MLSFILLFLDVMAKRKAVTDDYENGTYNPAQFFEYAATATNLFVKVSPQNLRELADYLERNPGAIAISPNEKKEIDQEIASMKQEAERKKEEEEAAKRAKEEEIQKTKSLIASLEILPSSEIVEKALSEAKELLKKLTSEAAPVADAAPSEAAPSEAAPSENVVPFISPSASLSVYGNGGGSVSML